MTSKKKKPVRRKIAKKDYEPALRIETTRPDPEDNIVDESVGRELLPESDTPAPASVASNPIHAKYPSPKKNKEFVARWKQLIGGVVSRSNFKMGHLYQLEILCDLYVEYDVLTKFIRMKGHTYTAHGRQGRIVKPYPQVTLLTRVQSEIRSYCKMLGLLMTPDKSGESGGEDSEWA